MSLLEVKGLYKSFDSLEVLKNLSFSVEENNITGLIGPNGCGKTTLFNIISGLLSADQGSIKYKNQELLGKKPHEIGLLGMSRTFQDTKLFKELTVLENLMLPPRNQIGEGLFNLFAKPKSVDNQEEELLDRAKDVLELLEITHMGYEYAKNLSGGQSKLVDLGRVLMSEPEILLLDEPTAGVNPVLTQKLFEKIVELRDQMDLTIVLIEHDMDVIMKDDVDHILVLNSGQVVAEGTASEIQSNKEVIEAYLGR